MAGPKKPTKPIFRTPAEIADLKREGQKRAEEIKQFKTIADMKPSEIAKELTNLFNNFKQHQITGDPVKRLIYFEKPGIKYIVPLDLLLKNNGKIIKEITSTPSSGNINQGHLIDVTHKLMLDFKLEFSDVMSVDVADEFYRKEYLIMDRGYPIAELYEKYTPRVVGEIRKELGFNKILKKK